MEHVPYFSITGVVSFSQLAAFKTIVPPPGREIVIGILVSDKTLIGHSEERNPSRFAPITSIAELVTTNGYTSACIHYFTRQPARLATELRLLTAYAGGIPGLQLNGVGWPRADQLRSFLADHKECRRVVIQVNGMMLSTVRTPQGLVRRFERYLGLATDLLFDLSQGTGQPLSPKEALRWLEPVREAYPDLGLVVAGGLNADDLELLLEPVVQRIPGVSWDAESALHIPKLEELDTDACVDFLFASSALAKRFPLPERNGRSRFGK